jgi:glycosyltransferase involved in cell wall biosynthesis
MVGDGPQRDEAERMCREMGLTKDVQFFGKSLDFSHLLAISDIFILPSEKESFGLAALEAMAAGLPIISSDTGGLSEVNIDQETGFTSAVGDINKMSSDTLKLLTQKDLYAHFSFNAREVSQSFDINKILHLYEAAYRKAIGLNCKQLSKKNQ